MPDAFAGKIWRIVKRSFAPLIFAIGRWLLAVAGIATLLATVVPGLMPFRSHIDPNLGLGGLVLFCMWPVIVAQIILGALPLGSKMLSKKPIPAWALLIIGCIIFLNVDNAALRLVYN